MKCIVTVIAIATAAAAGCADRSPPPERVVVDRDYPRREVIKPLPPPNIEDATPAPPYYDPPLVSQRMPEEQAFVNAYNAVGRPRILVFVNRTLEGQLVPVNADIPVAGIEHRRQSAPGRGESRESTEIYLHPGEYDEVQAKSLDYEAVENTLTDWLSADGRVAMVSPLLARQRMTDEQLKDLQSGRPRVEREIAQQLDAHVLIHIQAHPTRQTPEGLEVRIIAEAIDLKHEGGSLARAFVDVPPPLEKTQINKYTRFLSRKLMDGMIRSWESFGAPPPGANPAPRTGDPRIGVPPAGDPQLVDPASSPARPGDPAEATSSRPADTSPGQPADSPRPAEPGK